MGINKERRQLMHLLENFNYIQRTAKHAAESIANRTRIASWAWRIENVLPDDIIVDIRDFMAANQKWETEQLEFDIPRRAVHWDQVSTSPYRRMHYAFQQLSPVISEAIGHQVDFQHCNMWEDGTEYIIPPHVDNDSIRVAIQVYLNDADEDCGTSIYSSQNTEIYKFPFISNTGYIMHNTPTSWHGMMTPGNVRRSLYANYR